jgi:thiol-disulfide isomerase/thioredoxin
MGMVSIGPFAIPNGVFAGLLAFLSFTVLVSIAARRMDKKFDAWSTVALIVGLVVARLVYVALNWATFSSDPLRTFMFWQGGLEWRSGVMAAVACSFFMFRAWRTRGMAVAILGASVLVWLAAGVALNDTKEGMPLPDVTLIDAKGTQVELRQYAFGPVVVNLWATWCSPCRRELPAMAALAAQNPSLPFLFINQAEDPIAVQAFLKQQSLTLEHVLSDARSEVALALGTVGIPITLFFYDGALEDMHAGEISPEMLKRKTEALLNH